MPVLEPFQLPSKQVFAVKLVQAFFSDLNMIKSLELRSDFAYVRVYAE